MNKVSLENIATIINSGLTPLRSNNKFWDNGIIPWVKTEQLGEKYIYDSNEKITKHALENTSIKLNPANTLSIAMYGEGKTRGSVSILKNETTTNQACCNVVIDKDKADYEFVYYNLLTQYNSLRNLSSGVRKNLNSKDIKNFEISIPNLDEQKQIANVLKSLDQKIELNNQINTELEGMAKLVYDYWFVQFDFPISASCAAAVGKPELEGKPYKATGGNMVYNKELKREIPEGWGVKKLVDLENNIITGKTPSTKIKEYFDGDVPFITIDDIRQSLYVLKTDRTLTELGAHSQQNKFLYENDICVSCIGTIGVIGFVSKISQTNQQINSISKPKDYNRYFIYHYLKNYFEFNVGAKQGAVLSNMNKGDFESIPILDADVDIKKVYLSKVEAFFKTINNNLKENQELASLRDWLLPMLINGQATVGSPAGKRDENSNSKLNKKVEGYGEVQGELSPDKYREVAEEGAIYKESKN